MRQRSVAAQSGAQKRHTVSEHSEATRRGGRMLGALLHGMPGAVTAEPEPLDEPEPLAGALVVTPEPLDECCYSVWQYQHCDTSFI